MRKQRSDFDGAWKEILERYFSEFMAFFFPQAHREIDWSRRIEFLDKELRQVARHAGRGRYAVDKLVKVWRKDVRAKALTNDFVLWVLKRGCWCMWKCRARLNGSLLSGCSFITPSFSVATSGVSLVLQYLATLMLIGDRKLLSIGFGVVMLYILPLISFD